MIELKKNGSEHEAYLAQYKYEFENQCNFYIQKLLSERGRMKPRADPLILLGTLNSSYSDDCGYLCSLGMSFAAATCKLR